MLVTGGAGYVGSHIVRELVRQGERVVVLDDLSEGHREAAGEAELVEADLTVRPRVGEVLDRLFQRERFEVVLHFAGKAYVSESVRNPENYYRTNVGGGIELLAAMARNGVRAIIFSSTCATYGKPEAIPIREDHPQRPVSAYGRTKLAFEQALKDFETAYGIRHVNLRYFNAAGAHPDGDLGEDHRPETHLIPLACSVALGLRSSLSIFGNDYPTPDGTCIRDYIHVVDLAAAHILAVQALSSGAASSSYNVGTGRGHSVLEVVESVKRVSGREVTTLKAPRRPGDPPELVAANEKIRRELGWSATFTSLDDIVESAWRFQTRHPRGYGQA
ncbi:MAG: UDP-glucose 4-epimerase GalE [Acidobacteriota bacterium]